MFVDTSELDEAVEMIQRKNLSLLLTRIYKYQEKAGIEFSRGWVDAKYDLNPAEDSHAYLDGYNEYIRECQ